MHKVFITGGSGYIGSRLIPKLLERGHQVRALVRAESAQKLPTGCEVVIGDALDEQSIATHIGTADTFIQLVGVPHPNPKKAQLFKSIDFISASAAVNVVHDKAIPHLIYISVARPAPVMHAYIEVRKHIEQLIEHKKLNATILRPWYVLGPNHRWPYALIPFYWVLERIPATRESAIRLGLVTLEQMLNALVFAVEHPSVGIRSMNVPEIRNQDAITPRC